MISLVYRYIIVMYGPVLTLRQLIKLWYCILLHSRCTFVHIAFLNLLAVLWKMSYPDVWECDATSKCMYVYLPTARSRCVLLVVLKSMQCFELSAFINMIVSSLFNSVFTSWIETPCLQGTRYRKTCLDKAFAFPASSESQKSLVFFLLAG